MTTALEVEHAMLPAVLAVLRDADTPLDAYQVAKLTSLSPMLAGRALVALAEAGTVATEDDTGTANDLATRYVAVEESTCPSRRRTTARFGAVNFPINDPKYASSNEGGMFVKLVVVDDRDHVKSDWTICVGTHVLDHKSAGLVGDDRAAYPLLPPSQPDDTPEQVLAELDANDAKTQAWEGRHFPYLRDDEADDFERIMSRPYLASVLLANTGWSGLNVDTTEYWVCTHDDLTQQGKALYAQLQRLYPGCTLHLLTFLDT